MKSIPRCLIILLLSVLFSFPVRSQDVISWKDVITATDLKSYVTFLSSPLLQGRKNSEPGLDIAQQYIISQLEIMGIPPVSGKNYLQPYSITRYSVDPEESTIEVFGKNKDTVIFRKPIFQIVPTGPSDFTVEGEIVFAGYGLKQDRYGYDDFENIVTEDKIVLVMMGCPPAADGDGYMVEGVDWSSFQSLQVKLTPLLFTRAKAVLIVADPKSGYSSLEEQFPGISGELNSAISLKGQKPRIMQMPNMPKIMIVHSDVAEELLRESSYNLSGLQSKIDETGKPFSIEIPDKKVKITEVVKTEDMHLNNVAAYIEGSDPVLKNEYIVYSAHIDHIGISSQGVNTGADDNASGCAGLLSIAEAFQNLKKKPLRSVLFLWVSGEEIGLLGSRYYVNNPLVPLENTLVNLNADMIGRVKGPADTTADNPMTGPKEVFVISDNQSKELTTIAEAVDQQSVLDFNFSLSGRNHPLQLFSRSDHYNFVVKDIPVLFFFTGLHTDYHSPEDVVEKINFEKMELIAETMFQIGYEVANKKKRIVVDNPFSSW